MSNRYESGFVEPPRERLSELQTEVERLIVDVQRVYGDEFELGGMAYWEANDGSGNSYELRETLLKSGDGIQYAIRRRDINSQVSELKPLNWKKGKGLYVPLKQSLTVKVTQTLDDHINLVEKIMMDNYTALKTADLPVHPYVRPDSGEVIDIHEEFESIVAYAVDHRSYDHPVDNYHPGKILKLLHRIDKHDDRIGWRVPRNAFKKHGTEESSTD